MTDIVEFIRARLDEDDQVARKAASLCGCHPPVPSWRFGDESTDGRILIDDDPHREAGASPSRLHKRWNGSYQNMFAASHIVRHDPARVLREVEAKRGIVDEHKPMDGVGDRFVGCGTCSWRDDWDELHVEFACPTVRLLALPYAGHPDYREEWRT